MLTMLGVATGGVFLKNALDKLKIQAQTLQWKEYKGAAETLGRDAMSPAVRESMAGDHRRLGENPRRGDRVGPQTLS